MTLILQPNERKYKPMKRAVLYIIPLLIVTACMAEELRVGSGQIITISAATATPTVFTNANTWVRKVTIRGKKAARTNNTGTVYVGPTSGNDTQGFDIAAGGEAILEAAPGCLINLADWYVDVETANDGVMLVYH